MQESALAEPVSNYSKIVSFVTANKWPSLWMLRQRTQKTHKWRTTQYAFCSILTTQIPDMTEYTLILPTLCLQVCINVHIDSTVWMLLNYGLYTEKSKNKVTHTGTRAEEGLIYLECSTSISSTHKTEPDRGKLHSLCARSIKLRKIDLSQTLLKSPESYISPKHYVKCLSCQWHCISPAPSLQLLSLNCDL